MDMDAIEYKQAVLDMIFLEHIFDVASSRAVLAAFDRIILPPDDRTKSLEHQTNVLTPLRGTHLPKPISGELRVADVERIVGGSS